MLTGTPTIWNMALCAARARGLPHVIPQNSSINQAINDSFVIPQLPAVTTAGMEVTDDYNYAADTADVRLRLFCIGNGGHQLVQGGSLNIPTFEPKPHAATDAALYSILPFVVKPITNDLSGADRQKFRLRRTLEIDGELYAAYFGRVLPVTSGSVQMLLDVTPLGSATQTSVFTPSLDNIRLTDPNLSGNNTVTSVRASYTEQLTFTPQDVAWLEEACTLLYGSASYARISEIAICTGVDKQVTGVYPTTGTQVVNNINSPYYETVGCQAFTFNNTEAVAYGSNGFVLDIDTGASELLFARNE